MTELVRAIHSNISVNTSVRVFLDLKTLNFFRNIMGEKQEVQILGFPGLLNMQFKAFHSSNHFL